MTLSSPYFTHFGIREIHHVVPKKADWTFVPTLYDEYG